MSTAPAPRSNRALVIRAADALASGITRLDGLEAAAAVYLAGSALDAARDAFREAIHLAAMSGDAQRVNTLLEAGVAAQETPEEYCAWELLGLRLEAQLHGTVDTDGWSSLLEAAHERGGETPLTVAYFWYDTDPSADDARDALRALVSDAAADSGWAACARARFQSLMGDFAGSARTAHSALTRARATEDLQLQAHVLYRLGNALLDGGDSRDAAAALRECRRVALEACELDLALTAGLSLATVLRGDNDIAGAVQATRTVESIAQDRQLDRWLPAIRAELAYHLLAVGEHGAALELTTAAWDAVEADALDDPANLLLPTCHAFALLDAGAPAGQLAPVIASAIRLAEADGFVALRAYALLTQVRNLGAQGRIDDACALTRRIAAIDPARCGLLASTLARIAAGTGHAAATDVIRQLVSTASEEHTDEDSLHRAEAVATLAAIDSNSPAPLEAAACAWAERGRHGDARAARRSARAIAHPASVDTALGDLPRHVRDAVLAEAEVQFHAAGDVVQEAGTPSTHLLLVLDGCVERSTRARDGRHLVLGTIGAGGVFGAAALGGGDAVATATALEDTLVARVPATVVDNLMARHAEFSFLVLHHVTSRSSDDTQLAGRLATWPLENRVASELQRLLDEHGREILSGGMLIDHVVPQSDLAARVGVTRESVVRVLSSLRKRDILAARGRRIIVQDTEALAALARDGS